MWNHPNAERGIRNAEFRCRFAAVFLKWAYIKRVAPQALFNSTLRNPHSEFEAIAI